MLDRAEQPGILVVAELQCPRDGASKIYFRTSLATFRRKIGGFMNFDQRRDAKAKPVGMADGVCRTQDRGRRPMGLTALPWRGRC